MSTPNIEQISKANTELLAKSGAAAIAGYQELAAAYQALAAKNAERLTGAIQALAAAKTPAEFMELQQKLMAEGVNEAVKDSGDIAKLTGSVFTKAFEPVKTQIEALQSSFRN